MIKLTINYEDLIDLLMRKHNSEVRRAHAPIDSFSINLRDTKLACGQLASFLEERKEYLVYAYIISHATNICKVEG